MDEMQSDARAKVMDEIAQLMDDMEAEGLRGEVEIKSGPEKCEHCGQDVEEKDEVCPACNKPMQKDDDGAESGEADKVAEMQAMAKE